GRAAEAPPLEAQPGPDEDDDDIFTFEAPPPDDPPEPEVTPPRRRAAEAPRKPMKTPARFALRTLIGVTFLYALLSVYLRTHPDAVRAVFGRLPMIGTSRAEKRLDPSTVQLANVSGSYQRVKADHLVFAT